MKKGDLHNQPILIDAEHAAKLVSLGKSTWQRLAASGKIPAPIRLGRRSLWNPGEIKAWVAKGCPDRITWEKMKQVG